MIKEEDTYTNNAYECDNDESYVSEGNFPNEFEANKSPHSNNFNEATYPSRTNKNADKGCNFFVDSKYFGHSKALKRAFKIKHTVMKIFKYGTKDLYRFSNASLLEKYEPSL